MRIINVSLTGLSVGQVRRSLVCLEATVCVFVDHVKFCFKTWFWSSSLLVVLIDYIPVQSLSYTVGLFRF